jgi:hypothetical protein
MATLSYTDRTAPYAQAPYAQTRAPSGYVPHHPGSTIFLWIAWALAAAFWSATFSTALGILQAVTHPADTSGVGGVDAGGVGFALMDVVGGMVILGLAIAYGLYRYSTRDKRLDPVTEASTARLYDIVEAQGGEDMTTRSPEAREPLERDAYVANTPRQA